MHACMHEWLTVDQLAGVVPDDVHADDAARALLEDELEQPIGREDAAPQALAVQREALPVRSRTIGQPIVIGWSRKYGWRNARRMGKCGQSSERGVGRELGGAIENNHARLRATRTGGRFKEPRHQSD